MLEVVLPAGARQIAADDDLDRKHLEAPALERAAVLAQREQMVRDELPRPREPERRQAGEHPPLVGDLGRQDHVEHRDPVGGDEQQALVVERVELAHLAAADVDGGLRHGRCSSAERAQALEHDVDVTRVGAEVEDGIEVDAPRDLGVGADELREVEPLVPGAHRVTLHEPVRVVAREPGLDEREQQALAEVEAVARVEVLAHPLGADDEPLQQPGEPVEHVVDGEERVGQHDPLGRGVRDVALVPERDVLEPDDRVCADDARQPADPLGDDRVPLVRHRRRALLAASERLLDLAHLRPGEVADLEREPLERRRRAARAR